ncbi:hypothetical protein [Streptomyces sp. NPDC058193]|uniref:hypothetical protein n=1 Tax=Streptomyces sp. NPDC058193 TaxID=3346373 RepID=UPI0036EC8F9A
MRASTRGGRMRLLIDVVEGDHAAFYGSYGSRTAWRMTSLGSFRSAPDTAEGSQARWRDLHDHAFGRAFEISVSSSSSVAECSALALREARQRGAAQPAEASDHRDRVLRTWLTDSATGEVLDTGLTLAASGLTDGDLVVLCIQHPPRGYYEMAPAPNPAALLERMQLAMNGTAPDEGGRLWGVLLYTTADVELATYVRTHFEDLNALSGPSTRVFVIERQARWPDARKYWREHLEPELYRVLASLRWLRWQPYDPQGAYRIAELLGVDPALLPCLVLFNGRPGLPWGKQKAVFPVEDVTPRYFRTLFGRLAQALDGRPGSGAGPSGIDDEERRPEAGDGPTLLRDLLLRSARDRDEEAFDRVAAAQRAITAALEPGPAPHTGYQLNHCKVILTSGAAMTENFTFNGQNTTFINRPVNTVVQDFQNQHGTAAHSDDLRRLLELTLSSTDLSDTDRDEAAQAVHDLATLSEEPDAGPFRLRAERLRELLSGAADIAQSALALITTVVTAVTG